VSADAIKVLIAGLERIRDGWPEGWPPVIARSCLAEYARLATPRSAGGPASEEEEERLAAHDAEVAGRIRKGEAAVPTAGSQRDAYVEPGAQPPPSEPAPSMLSARLFHETYERLAPRFGYTTRAESAVPWDDVPANNRALMEATVAEVFAAHAAELRRVAEERDEQGRIASDAIFQCNDLRAKLAEAERELADARHACEKLHHNSMAKLAAERDAALAKLARLEAGLKQIDAAVNLPGDTHAIRDYVRAVAAKLKEEP
jgi:hypothetical protein